MSSTATCSVWTLNLFVADWHFNILPAEKNMVLPNIMRGGLMSPGTSGSWYYVPGMICSSMTARAVRPIMQV